MRWVQTKLCWRALSRGAARGWAEEMTHLQTLSSAQMRKIPKILRLLGYTGTLSSAAVGLQVRTQPWQWPALWSTSVCLTLFSCGGFCLLYKTCSVPLTLVLSKWETSFLMQPPVYVPGLLCWCRQVPWSCLEKGSAPWLSHPLPCRQTLSSPAGRALYLA